MNLTFRGLSQLRRETDLILEQNFKTHSRKSGKLRLHQDFKYLNSDTLRKFLYFCGLLRVIFLFLYTCSLWSSEGRRPFQYKG